MIKIPSTQDTTENSLILQNYIKHSLDTLKLKGFSPLSAASTIIGFELVSGDKTPDWIDVEYFVYWHLKTQILEEKIYE